MPVCPKKAEEKGEGRLEQQLALKLISKLVLVQEWLQEQQHHSALRVLAPDAKFRFLPQGLSKTSTDVQCPGLSSDQAH
jgi:hypothetical protein